MAERVVLHIGAPKSGTTYLQSVVWANKEALAGAGILVPGEVPFDHDRVVGAVTAPRPRPRAVRTWRRIRDEVADWSGTALITNEWFAHATREQAQRFVGELEEVGGRVDLVFTARELSGIVPAAWQEQLKLGRGIALESYLDRLEANVDKWSWQTLDPGEVLPRWSPPIPADRVHVVTVPPRAAGPNLLWERFAQVAGIPDGLCDLTRTTANESLGVESARLLELMGGRLRAAVDADGEGVPWTQQYAWLRRYLSHHLLVPRGGDKIALAEEDLDRLATRSAASAERIRAEGYTVVGDLAEYTRSGQSPDAVRPGAVSDADLLAVSMDLVERLLADLNRSNERPPF